MWTTLKGSGSPNCFKHDSKEDKLGWIFVTCVPWHIFTELQNLFNISQILKSVPDKFIRTDTSTAQKQSLFQKQTQLSQHNFQCSSSSWVLHVADPYPCSTPQRFWTLSNNWLTDMKISWNLLFFFFHLKFFLLTWFFSSFNEKPIRNSLLCSTSF